MATFAAECPACSTKLKVPDTVKPGTRVKCPKCANPFALPAPPGGYGDEGIQPESPRRKSRVENYGSGAMVPQGQGLEGLPTKYKIDIVGLFRVAWANVWSVVFPLLGFGIVAGFIFPFTVLTLFIAAIPLMVGPQIVALKHLKGEPWGFGDFFGGFKFFLPLILSGILSSLVLMACILPGFILSTVGGAFAGAGAPAVPDPPALRSTDPFHNLQFSTKPGEMIVAPPASSSSGGFLAAGSILGLLGMALTGLGYMFGLYLVFRINFFANALIFDQGMGAIEALKGSWRLTGANQVGVIFLVIIEANILTFSVYLCFLPVLVGFPLILLMHSAAYLSAVGKLQVPD